MKKINVVQSKFCVVSMRNTAPLNYLHPHALSVWEVDTVYEEWEEELFLRFELQYGMYMYASFLS